MTNDEGREPEGAPERSPKAGAGARSGVDRNGRKRFSVQRKLAIAARLLRGEPLDLVARQTNVSVARLTEWRDRALASAAAAQAAIDVFAEKYGAKYDKAVACPTKDREALLAFFDFPAEHWGMICGHRIRSRACSRRCGIAP
jgi:transposase-like protein